MDKIILSDVDSVLLNFNAGFEIYLRELNYPIRPDFHSHNNLTSALNLSFEEEQILVHNFFETDGVFELSAVSHAIDAVQTLYGHGWDFVAISACPSSQTIRERRFQNLEEVFGINFLDLHLTGAGGCKKSVLSSYDPAIWVEDNHVNAVVGHELGHRTFLIDYPHNRIDGCPVERVNDWKEIMDAIR